RTAATVRAKLTNITTELQVKINRCDENLVQYRKDGIAQEFDCIFFFPIINVNVSFKFILDEHLDFCHHKTLYMRFRKTKEDSYGPKWRIVPGHNDTFTLIIGKKKMHLKIGQDALELSTVQRFSSTPGNTTPSARRKVKQEDSPISQNQ